MCVSKPATAPGPVARDPPAPAHTETDRSTCHRNQRQPSARYKNGSEHRNALSFSTCCPQWGSFRQWVVAQHDWQMA